MKMRRQQGVLAVHGGAVRHLLPALLQGPPLRVPAARALRPYPNIKRGPAPSHPPPIGHQKPERWRATEESEDWGSGGVLVGVDGIVGNAGLEVRLRDEPAPPHPWEKPEENQRGDNPIDERADDHLKPRIPSHPAGPDLPENLHLPEPFVLGREQRVATQKEYSGKAGGVVANRAGEGNRKAGQRKPLEVQQQPSMNPKAKTRARGNGKRL
ncbi:hypothetical protein KUCAC02_036655, partial [Chaenocephalus aceratus]